jgi:hypothetical protein
MHFTHTSGWRFGEDKEMVLGVPAGPWIYHSMVDDEFEEPTLAEMRQLHIRAAVFAVHPRRGQWVRDAQGRLGVLAANADWKKDPLYNGMMHVNNGGFAAPANGAGAVPAAAPVAAVYAPGGANAQPLGAAAGPLVGVVAPANGAGAVPAAPAAAPVGAVYPPGGANAQPLGAAAGPLVFDLTESDDGEEPLAAGAYVIDLTESDDSEWDVIVMD